MSNKQENVAKQETVSAPIQEVEGIATATTGIEATFGRLKAAIQQSQKSNSDLEEFRKYVVAMPEKTLPEQLAKKHTIAHQAEFEAEIADAGRKAVNAALLEVHMHLTTINQMEQAIRSKYGKPEPTVKKADRGTGRGDITAGNMDALRELLAGRGLPVTFELQDDNRHYIAVSGDKRTKYAQNIRDDWR